MGMLVNGKWTDDDGKSRGTDGKFDHLPTFFRDNITLDGSSGFKAEADRYHIFVTKTCPWAHRTILFRHLKDLKDVINIHFASSGEQGYRVDSNDPYLVPGTEKRVTFLHEIYALSDPNYTGRVTVPTLWDAKKAQIVNNESSEIIRMLNSQFSECNANLYDYYPDNLRDEIDEINELIYATVNNGVYKAGFSSNQTAYEEAFDALFDTFEILENRLSNKRFLCGNHMTEADWRLFPTLFRFDTVYHYAFKCNKKHLYEYSNLWGYTRDLYQQPGISDWCYLEEAKVGYWSGPKINPLGTIPKGPNLNFFENHDRDRFQ